MVMVEMVLHAGGVIRVQGLIEALARRQVAPAAAFSFALGGVDEAGQEWLWGQTMERLSRLED
jgi:hypothetical protein